MPRHARERENLLGRVPCREADWEERGGRVVIRRPAPVGRGLGALREGIRYVLGPPRIRLDEVGSRAWHLCDGSRTVGEVAELLRREFGERVEPVEERVGRLMEVLADEGLLGLK